VKPTRVRTLLLIALVFALITRLLLTELYSKLPPLSWTFVPALLIAAVAETWTGRDLHARITGRTGYKPAPPLFVARMVALAKASSQVAALIAGVAAGFCIYLSGMLDATTPRNDMIVAAVTFGASLVLAVAALYLEYSCRVPKRPDSDREDEPVPPHQPPWHH
jgi:uncharacterized protein DUF3180